MAALQTRPSNPLPSSVKLTFGLVGNQNCGKTTLFNQLTGANQHVGNFPGVYFGGIVMALLLRHTVF